MSRRPFVWCRPLFCPGYAVRYAGYIDDYDIERHLITITSEADSVLYKMETTDEMIAQLVCARFILDPCPEALMRKMLGAYTLNIHGILNLDDRRPESAPVFDDETLARCAQAVSQRRSTSLLRAYRGATRDSQYL